MADCEEYFKMNTHRCFTVGKIWLKHQHTGGNQISFNPTGTEARSSTHSILCNQSFSRENTLNENKR